MYPNKKKEYIQYQNDFGGNLKMTSIPQESRNKKDLHTSYINNDNNSDQENEPSPLDEIGLKSPYDSSNFATQKESNYDNPDIYNEKQKYEHNNNDYDNYQQRSYSNIYSSQKNDYSNNNIPRHQPPPQFTNDRYQTPPSEDELAQEKREGKLCKNLILFVLCVTCLFILL